MKSVTRYLISSLTPHIANKSLGTSIQSHHWLRVPNISRCAGTHVSSLPDSVSQVPPSGRRGTWTSVVKSRTQPDIIHIIEVSSFSFFLIFQLQTGNSSLAKDLCSNQQKVCMDSILIRALKDSDVIQINLVMGCQITHRDKFPQNLSLISVFWVMLWWFTRISSPMVFGQTTTHYTQKRNLGRLPNFLLSTMYTS